MEEGSIQEDARIREDLVDCVNQRYAMGARSSAETGLPSTSLGEDKQILDGEVHNSIVRRDAEKNKTEKVQRSLQEVYPGLPPYICHPQAEAKRRVDLMLQNSPCGLIVTACSGGRDAPILYVNKIFEFMTGYEANEIIGRDCRFLQFRGMHAKAVHHLVDKSTVKKIRLAIEQKTEFRGELLNFRKDGTPLTNSLYITPIRGDPSDPQQVTHIVGIQNFRSAEYLNLPSIDEENKIFKKRKVCDSQEYILPTANNKFDEVGKCIDESGILLKENEDICHRIISEKNSQPSTSYCVPNKICRVDECVSIHGTKECPIHLLSDEVCSIIFGYLKAKELANVSLTCRRFKLLTQSSILWQKALINSLGESETREIRMTSGRVSWKRLASDVMGLQNVAWRPFGVGGLIRPTRTNFSLCAMGSKIILFGGEGSDGTAFNCLYVLDFLAQAPCWTKVPEHSPPPAGRWGHTFNRICDNWLVMFGGTSGDGPLNDCFLLEITEDDQYKWHSVTCDKNTPKPRSWHTSTVVNGSKFAIFGGCDATGNLLSDTWILDFGSIRPQWKEIAIKFKPPSRLGHSMCGIEGSKLFMFGGFATAGAVRLRTADAFMINIDDAEPSWKYMSGSVLPSGAMSLGDVPTPRLQHVAINLWNGVIAVLGGSISELDENKYASTQVYTIRPMDTNPRWKLLSVSGIQPTEAWGYSACRVGSSILLPSQSDNGSLSLNDFYALSFSNNDEGMAKDFKYKDSQIFWRESNTRKSSHSGKDFFPKQLPAGAANALNDDDGCEQNVHAGSLLDSDGDMSTDAQLLSVYAQDAEIRSRGQSPGSSNGASASDESVNSPNDFDYLPTYLKTLVNSQSRVTSDCA